MKLTDNLQNIIEKSEFLKTIRDIKDSITGIDKSYRPLTGEEIKFLEKNGNSAEDWSMLRVEKDFSPQFISGNRFNGRCMLGKFTGEKLEVQDGAMLPSGIYDSVIVNSYICSESLVNRCGLVSNYYISGYAVIFNTGTITAGKQCSFGNDIIIPAGPETGEIPIPLFADMDMETAELLLENAHKPELFSDYTVLYRNSASLDRGVVGKKTIITDTSTIRDTFTAEGAVIRGAIFISGSTILSSGDEITTVGSGVRIENSMLQYGCEINSSSILYNSLMMEHSEAENQSRVSSSIIGPNSSLGGGEVTSAIAGPFTVSHHQSLLIAALWPAGRGNIGYGANVGSNHTSRLPDQEIHPGEGMFFGLGCSIKFPSDFRKAPYSLIATGTVTQAQKVEFPFSLIIPPSSLHKDIPLHMNELIPAWALRENIYSILRNEAKYRSRNRSRRSTIDFTILRPGIIDLMIIARERLQNGGPYNLCFNENDIPGTGKNFITDESRILGIETYTFYIQHYALKALFKRIEEVLQEGKGPDHDILMNQAGGGYWPHAVKVLIDEKLSGNSLKENMEALTVSLEKIYYDALESRRKDYTKGIKIVDGYSRNHKTPENDPTLRDLRKATEAKILRIRELISVLS